MRIKPFCEGSIRRIARLFRDTKAEVVLGAVLGVGVGIYCSHLNELDRDKLIPVSFSELSQLEDRAREEGEKLDVYTHYIAGVNDFPMKVFESWNHSWADSNSDREAYLKFAEYLGDRMRGESFRRSLSRLIEEVPENARTIKKELKEFEDAKRHIDRVSVHFDNAWRGESVDHFTMVPAVSIDANGNLHTTLESKYESTTHNYIYDSDEGERASQKLDETLETFSDLSVNVKNQPLKWLA